LYSIAQSQLIPGAKNTLTTSISTSCDLREDSRITISGLTGSTTASNSTFMLLSSPLSISATAHWNISGVLILDVTSQVVSSDVLVVSFELENGEANQQPGPEVNITGYVEAGLSNIQNTLTRSNFKSLTMSRPGTPLQSVQDGSAGGTCWNIPHTITDMHALQVLVLQRAKKSRKAAATRFLGSC